jgi:hypothetical protein
MAFDLATVCSEAASTIVRNMDRVGYAVIRNAVSGDQIERMRAFVSAAVERSGQQYVSLVGPEAVAGSSLDSLSMSPEFQDLFRQIYREGTGLKPPEVRFYQVLRCLKGRTGLTHSMRFHYDSYVLTGLVPIEIPTAGRTGDLIMLPNTRKIRRYYAANVLDKLVLDNWATQAALRMCVRMNWIKVTRVRLEPGNLYLFWGYRTIHTNEACDPDHLRATALFHYANPHAESNLMGELSRFRPTTGRDRLADPRT